MNEPSEADMPAPPFPLAIVGPEPVAPPVSGIYFIYASGTVAYVGQSKCLALRVRLGHHAILEGDCASWLEFPPEELLYAECFYIWKCRPARNKATPAR